MPDQDDGIQQRVGLVDDDAFEITTEGETDTGKRLYADGGDGKEKEATVRSPHAGASSEAPPSSGIPSAMTQASIYEDAESHDATQMGGRAIPMKQDVEP